MSIQIRNIIKNWFQTGSKPTQAQFRDWIDSFFHLSEDTLPATKVDGLQDLLDAKITEAPQDGNQYARINGEWQEVVIDSGGGSGYFLKISENPIYNPDGTLKIIKYQYVDDNTKFYEERYEFTNGFVTKIEIKDDMNEMWVQKTDIYNAQEQLQAPTITDITAWTII